MAFEFLLGTSGREVHPLWEGLPLPFSKYFLTNPSQPPWLRRFLFLPMKKAMSRPVPSLRPLMERQYCTCNAFTSKRHAQFLSYLDRKKSGFLPLCSRIIVLVFPFLLSKVLSPGDSDWPSHDHLICPDVQNATLLMPNFSLGIDPNTRAPWTH